MENQDAEYKLVWKDEYLKTLASFANSEGGQLIIGMEDNGTAAGVHDAKEVAKKISDTIVNVLAIYPSVVVNADSTITITVEPSDELILYHAKVYKRVGSTTAEVKGRELQRLLMRKLNASWTEEPMPDETVDSLDPLALSMFRKMGRDFGRLNEDELGLDDISLLEKLGLLAKGVPKRAAVLLFHENPQKFMHGASVYIGMFEGSDMLFDDRLDGPLILVAKKAIDLVTTKYIITPVAYEGIFRMDVNPYPKQALREAIMNAIVHNDYSDPAPIQIKVTKDTLTIYNSGNLPYGWTIESLVRTHTSEPRNPSLAKAFYRAGMIEAFGRGMNTIIDAYKDRDVNPPIFNDGPRGFSVIFRSEIASLNMAGNGQHYGESEHQHIRNDVLKILKDGPMSTSEIMVALSCDMKRSNFVNRVLSPLRDQGIIEYTIPEKANSRDQRYRLSGR